MKQYNNKTINVIMRELFYVFTGALVIFAILEVLWPRVVLVYININWVLIIWLFTGILVLIINNKNNAR